jgi:nicotinamide/nicotinate riboside kinase
MQPEDTLPIHPTLGQDWDTAATAINWPRLRAFLRTVKRIARIPDDHSSHDHMNPQAHVPLDHSVAARCKADIAAAQKEVEAASGARVVWGLVDGFLLYWDQVCTISSWHPGRSGAGLTTNSSSLGS